MTSAFRVRFRGPQESRPGRCLCAGDGRTPVQPISRSEAAISDSMKLENSIVNGKKMNLAFGGTGYYRVQKD